MKQEFYRYYSKQPVRVTIIVREVGDNLVFAASRCSTDDNFSKAKGYEKALERFNTGKFCYAMSTLGKNTTITDFTRILKYLSMVISVDARLLETEDFRIILEPLGLHVGITTMENIIVPSVVETRLDWIKVNPKRQRTVREKPPLGALSSLQKNKVNLLTPGVQNKLTELKAEIEKTPNNGVNIFIVFG